MIQLGCLPLKLAFDPKTLALRLNGRKLVPSFERTVGEMRSVMLSPQAALSDSSVCYRVFRRVERPADRKAFAENDCSYDVTVLERCFLGPERNKTMGHYHSIASNGLTYPEVYEVLYGEAHFVLQRRSAPSSREVSETLFVTAKQGEKVVVEPRWGHAVINASHEPLVLASLDCMLNESDYAAYLEKHGAAYYKFGANNLLPNKHYHKLPPLHIFPASSLKPVPKIGEANLYADYTTHPQRYSFLKNPERIWKA
ncbi:TPA: hypothetical protein HA318_01345 [Candidatus Micrarchaeota archaeon]|nr:MAG: hypothetical protein AUJ65_00565 [Candidatus Micrarchaeota archaeon CG1_02_51_15]HII38632.1 hypothetical protein [Candidatus Micrarchaeota archaeon]